MGLKVRRGILSLLPLLLLAVVVAGGVRPASASDQSERVAAPASSCTGQTYSDVCIGDWYYQYVMDLTSLGAISGYSDGTFKPNNEISRGQIMKVLVQATGLNAAMPTTPTFADVSATHTFYLWIEIGAANGIASGYPCGGTGEGCDSQHRPYFRPWSSVTRGQLAKMIVLAKHWSPLTPGSPTFRDVPSNSTFFSYVERVAANGVIGGYTCGGAGEPCPGSYFRPNGTSTRAQAAKMVSLARMWPATPTPLPATPTPVVSAGGCQVFPANNIWNKNIASLPKHPNSDAYMRSIGLSANVHADFGSGLWDGGPIGIPYVFVNGSQPFVQVHWTAYGDESDPGPYPVPTSAPIEGGPQSSGDRHVLVVDSGNCKLYELYDAYPNSDGTWNADSGAIFDLNSNALRPNGWTSGDAAGLPIYPGLVRYDEVVSGVIRHAIRFTAPNTQDSHLWPARHDAGHSGHPEYPPMGLRVRLKASFDISPYPQQVRVILQAMKDYGLILADNGSPWYISGAPDPRWDNEMLHTMDNITGADFEAVDESGLMVDPNSGQSR
jgi:S-layer homology domain